MNNKPTEPTTAEIQAAHDLDCAADDDSRANYMLLSLAYGAAHIHRGILLRRLDEAEATIAACNYVLEQADLGVDIPNQLKQAQARLNTANKIADRMIKDGVWKDDGYRLQAALKGD